ncbi:hypothetical protein, partial [Parendozoicomonas haliclonae]
MDGYTGDQQRIILSLAGKILLSFVLVLMGGFAISSYGSWFDFGSSKKVVVKYNQGGREIVSGEERKRDPGASIDSPMGRDKDTHYILWEPGDDSGDGLPFLSNEPCKDCKGKAAGADGSTSTATHETITKPANPDDLLRQQRLEEHEQAMARELRQYEKFEEEMERDLAENGPQKENFASAKGDVLARVIKNQFVNQSQCPQPATARPLSVPLSLIPEMVPLQNPNQPNSVASPVAELRPSLQPLALPQSSGVPVVAQPVIHGAGMFTSAPLLQRGDVVISPVVDSGHCSVNLPTKTNTALIVVPSSEELAAASGDSLARQVRQILSGNKEAPFIQAGQNAKTGLVVHDDYKAHQAEVDKIVNPVPKPQVKESTSDTFLGRLIRRLRREGSKSSDEETTQQHLAWQDDRVEGYEAEVVESELRNTLPPLEQKALIVSGIEETGTCTVPPVIDTSPEPTETLPTLSTQTDLVVHEDHKAHQAEVDSIVNPAPKPQVKESTSDTFLGRLVRRLRREGSKSSDELTTQQHLAWQDDRIESYEAEVVEPELRNTLPPLEQKALIVAGVEETGTCTVPPVVETPPVPAETVTPLNAQTGLEVHKDYKARQAEVDNIVNPEPKPQVKESTSDTFMGRLIRRLRREGSKSSDSHITEQHLAWQDDRVESYEAEVVESELRHTLPPLEQKALVVAGVDETGTCIVPPVVEVPPVPEEAVPPLNTQTDLVVHDDYKAYQAEVDKIVNPVPKRQVKETTQDTYLGRKMRRQMREGSKANDSHI